MISTWSVGKIWMQDGASVIISSLFPGTDSTHLTMFEMMGSWSFGDYWKREACTMAWHLVTEVFKLEKEKLFVTYFAGSGDLLSDLETRDIWRSLGEKYLIYIDLM